MNGWGNTRFVSPGDGQTMLVAVQGCTKVVRMKAFGANEYGNMRFTQNGGHGVPTITQWKGNK